MATHPSVRLLLLSKDTGLMEAIAHALGSDFESRNSNDMGHAKPDDWRKWCEVALLDLRASGTGGNQSLAIHFMDQIRESVSRPPMIVFCDEEDRSLMLQAMKRGAYDTVGNPPNIVKLRLILQQAAQMHRAEEELETLRVQANDSGRMDDLLGSSGPMQELFALSQKIATCDVSVLITGETGTGKELLARAIHRISQRAARPLVAFSCANLPETLIEDELFGHEKGAFTGALTSRRGRLEMAEHGTLFLDEIGDLSMSLQPKLLRVLQERSFERLGSSATTSVNIRVISASNRNLTELVQQGRFREDLYYRINVVQMHIPPLRERQEDIPLLANHFLQLSARQFNRKATAFSQPALRSLEEYGWPGNVRELENAVKRAVVLVDGETVELWHLPATVLPASEGPAMARSYEEEVRQFKRRLIFRTLRECGWQKAETARALGIARGYLHRLINQLDIRQKNAEIRDTQTSSTETQAQKTA
ncbi:MAG: sigma-54 dependent transcriptional regulator [Candidatus Acidiferrales bacterium]